MTSVSTCPFCNAILPAASDGGRVTCPRCFETVGGGRVAESHATATSVSRSTSRWILYAIPLALFVAAGIVALSWRPWSTSPTTGPADQGAPTAVRPVDMPGLGYVPESCEMVFAIQMPLLLAKLGPEAAADPAKAIAKLGIPETVVETIDQASGVGLENVDLLVVGIGFQKGSLPPQLVVVVTTRQPYNFTAMLRQAKATTLKKDGRTLHVIKSSPVPNVYWWSPNDRVLLGTIAARDFEGVPLEPRAGVNHLQAELAALIRNDVADDACAWLVASSDKWAQYLAPYVLLPVGPLQGRRDLSKAADRLRSLVVSIPHGERPIDVQMELKTAQDAEKLRAIYRERYSGEHVEVSGDGTRCRLTTPFKSSQVGSILTRLVGDK